VVFTYEHHSEVGAEVAFAFNKKIVFIT
jgi:hypothetical protein